MIHISQTDAALTSFPGSVIMVRVAAVGEVPERIRELSPVRRVLQIQIGAGDRAVQPQGTVHGVPEIGQQALDRSSTVLVQKIVDR